MSQGRGLFLQFQTTTTYLTHDVKDNPVILVWPDNLPLVKGGEYVREYELLIEELEEKIAPAILSMGGQ